jgi:hypothetical protein
LTRAAEEQNVDITIVELNSNQTAAYCAQVYNETGQHDGEAESEDEFPTLRRVHHIHQQELDAAVAGALKHFRGSRWVWDRFGSAVDISPLNACTWAVGAGEVEEWIGGQYAVADSLG